MTRRAKVNSEASNKKPTTLVLINPEARSGKLRQFWKKNKDQVLSRLQDVYEVIQTNPEDHGQGIVKQALKRGIKRVIVIGGDGTLSQAVQGFFEQKKRIAPEALLVVLPGGSGDDFYKTLSRRKFVTYHRAWKYALRILSEGKSTLADVGQYTWIDSSSSEIRHFLNIVGFGLPGRIIQRVQNKAVVFGQSRARQGKSTYLLNGILSFFEYRAQKIQVYVDGESVFEGPVYSGFILNGKYNASGILWDPDAAIDDGVFHLLLVEKWIFGIPWIYRKRGKKIEIRLLDPPHPKGYPFFEADGDLLPHENGRRILFELLPGALQLQVASNSFTALHPDEKL